MARRVRIEYAGAAYHVMARGNQGRPIYEDDRDRKVFGDVRLRLGRSSLRAFSTGSRTG